MSSTFGNVLHLSIFGQSHSPAIGCSLDGIPAGIAVDQEKLQAFLDRRAPGRDETATKRREADTAHIIAGVVDGHTTGAPIAAIIENTNTRSKDYSELRRKPRPGHADFPARVKYHNMHDVAGGGHFSGRLTAPSMHRRRYRAAGARGPRHSGHGARRADRRHLRPADGRYGLS